jgi:hypothetical protein
MALRAVQTHKPSHHLELSLIANHGIAVVPFHTILHQLKHVSAGHRGAAGTDISEIVEYFAEHGIG